MQDSADRAVPFGEATQLDATPEAVRLDALALKASRGDRAAFGEITEMMLDGLLTYVVPQCESSEDGEDVVTQVFSKAWRSAASYRPGSRTYQNWIHTIARNAVRDYRKRKQRERHAALPPLVRLARRLRPERPPAETKLQDMLGRLTEPQREVILLRFFEQLSFAEIGEIIGKREGAARALLHRAMRRLDGVLGDE